MNMPDVAARWLSHPGPSPVPDTMLDPEASALRGLAVTGKRQEGSCSDREAHATVGDACVQLAGL